MNGYQRKNQDNIQTHIVHKKTEFSKASKFKKAAM